jgi:glycosyltransferase involved in cell wall biosynthesis
VAEQDRDDRRLSLVVPVYNEADNILHLLEALRAQVAIRHETILVYDFDEDTTLPPARSFEATYPELRLVKNEIGPGVLNAIKAGIGHSLGDVVIVTMADLSDDLSQIEELTSLVRDGAAVAVASRYMPGGAQLGGPPIKSMLSRLAGLSLYWLTDLETHDPTNNYKAYSRSFLEGVDIESTSGFELGLELTTKAHLTGLPVVEIPTTWRDRTAGESRFKILKWMPGYLRWYLRCLFGSWAGHAHRARAEAVRSSQRRSAGLSRG